MRRSKQKNITKIRLVSLIEFADYLSQEEKSDWKELVNEMQQFEVNAAYNHFKKQMTKRHNFGVLLIAKNNKADKLINTIEVMANNLITQFNG